MSEKTTAKAIKADLAQKQALEPVPRDPSTVPAFVTADQLDLIRRTVAKDATEDELKSYLFDCQRQGVHPLDRLIHFTVRIDKRTGERRYTPVTSIDFMRIRAADSGEYAGSDDVIYGDTQGLPEVPVTATVTVWRLVQGQRCSFTATARWAEYKPDQAFMWHKMPFLMLGKCAEALALRKGFPKQLAGLYAKEEMDQAENGEPRQKAAQKPQDASRREKDPLGLPAVGGPGVPLVVPPKSGPSGGWAIGGSPSQSTPTNVNPYTGEEYPPCPAGAAYVWKYELDNGWHRGWLSGPGHAQVEVKTRYDTGLLLKAAAESHKPVVYSANVRGFLSKLDWWIGPIAKQLATALRKDEPPVSAYDDESTPF